VNILKAIELLNKIPYLCTAQESSEFKEAIQMGIEALKVIKATRRETGCESFAKLPGETKD